MTIPARVLAAIVALAIVAPPAQAAFPGRNGAIGYGFTSESGDSGPLVQSAGMAAKRLGEDPRVLIRCERTEGVSGDCTLRRYGSLSYSPGGKRLVFDAGEQLGVIGAGGAGLYFLSAATADDSDPAFGPGGKRIVFSGLNDRGGTDLYVRRVGGGEARMIVTDAREPAWSSRNEIAYVRDRKIYVARADGTHRRFVTSGESPDWSPDGRRLLLVRPISTGRDGRMFVVGSRGRGLRSVFPRVRDAFGPVWSPDGRWIAFQRFDMGILAKRLGSRAPAQEVAVTQISGESGSVVSFDPAWRPLR